MKKAKVFVSDVLAGVLVENIKGQDYIFTYLDDYKCDPVSLTMPILQKTYHFTKFPPFFEGLLPEGAMLEALLKLRKLDFDDYFEQLMVIGKEVVGNVTVERLE